MDWMSFIIPAITALLGIGGTLLTFKAKKKQAFAEADGAVLENKKKEIENQAAYHDIYVRMSKDLEDMVNKRLAEKDRVIEELNIRIRQLEEKVESYEMEIVKRDKLISAALSCKNVAKCPVMLLRSELFAPIKTQGNEYEVL